MTDESGRRVRPGGSNVVRLAAPEKLVFLSSPDTAVSVEKDFPEGAALEPTGFAPAVHREYLQLLATTEVRPPAAALLVIRLFPGKNPRDEEIVVRIADDEEGFLDCDTLRVDEHAHAPREDGTVDFPVLLVFGDPEEIPEGGVFEGLRVVDVSRIESESAPSQVHFTGGSWGEKVLPVQELNLEVERF